MSGWEEHPAFVLDNGSGIVKAGFGGDEQPRSVFAAVIGVPRNAPSGASVVVGDDALAAASKGGFSLRYPVEHGIVSDWEGMERLWRKAYDELKVAPQNQAALVTEAPMNPKQNREKMASVLFEGMDVPAMHIQIQAVLSLYSGGRTDGVVLDSGDGVTHAVPIFQGHSVPCSVSRLDLAGRDLTEWMMQLLSDELERPFTTTRDRETVRDIKESVCYVAEDFDAELQAFDSGDARAKKKSFKLPDGQEVQIGRSCICCPEIFFQPSLAEKPCVSVQQLVYNSVMACPIDTRKTLLHNVLLSGGSTMFQGIENRLTKELVALTTKRAQSEVRVVAPGERKYSVWIGAAILASLTSFSAEWITRAEYNEIGPAIVHKRCDALGFTEK